MSTSELTNFNITRRNLKYLLPVLALIIVPIVLRIGFDMGRGTGFFIGILVSVAVYHIPQLQVSSVEHQQVDEGKQSVFLWIFLPIIAALIILPVFYGPYVEYFMTHVLHINPETALDSIRSFLGIHVQN